MRTILILAVALALAGCANGRRPAEKILSTTEAVIITDICTKAWLPTGYSASRDTPETVSSNRANNRAREAFCRANVVGP